MKITQNQIDELYQFTRKHFVYHYDVQTELVDHLANDIEAIWVENPKLSFEQARDQSFKKFGIFGFMDVIEAKQKQLGKKYNKILFRFMKEWFSIPKIMITLLIFGFFYSLLNFQVNEIIFLIILFCLAIVDVILAHKLVKKANQRFKQNQKKFLLEEMIFRTGSFNTIIIFSNFFQLSNFTHNLTSDFGKFLFAFFITLAIIFSYVTLIIIPQKAEELLQETYPEYKMVKSL